MAGTDGFAVAVSLGGTFGGRRRRGDPQRIPVQLNTGAIMVGLAFDRQSGDLETPDWDSGRTRVGRKQFLRFTGGAWGWVNLPPVSSRGSNWPVETSIRDSPANGHPTEIIGGNRVNAQKNMRGFLQLQRLNCLTRLQRFINMTPVAFSVGIAVPPYCARRWRQTATFLRQWQSFSGRVAQNECAAEALQRILEAEAGGSA